MVKLVEKLFIYYHRIVIGEVTCVQQLIKQAVIHKKLPSEFKVYITTSVCANIS